MTIVLQPSGISSLTWAFIIAVSAAAGCVAILAFLLKTGLAWRLATDVPNERSLHERPTPRVGGWGIVPVVLLVMVVTAPSLWLLAICTLFVAAVSQVDDRRGLSARVRFATHLAAAVALVAVYPAGAAWWALVVLSILLVWLVNLYNFMDGSDGLAGGMAFFGFGAYAVAALMGDRLSPELAFACAAVAGAAVGFLYFNVHPARIFLGDVGSIPIGFLAGGLGYWGWRANVWPIWFPAMAFAPFIADASVTLLRRFARGEKFWQAHREHYYQRMVRSGVGHGRTALYWWCMMFFGTIVALWALGRAPAIQWIVVVVWALVLVLVGAAIDLRWRRFRTTGQAEG